jgi:hypothetical protein
MIRLSANLSKKVPVPGLAYSSQQFGAAMEVEVGDGDDPAVIHERIRSLYTLLSQAIDEQIQHAGNGVSAAPQPVAQLVPVSNGVNRVAARNGNGNGNGHAPAQTRSGKASTSPRRVTATEAQCRAIHAICKAQGLDVAEVLADYNVAKAEELHVRDASTLIDSLKAQQNNQPQ